MRTFEDGLPRRLHDAAVEVKVRPAELEAMIESRLREPRRRSRPRRVLALVPVFLLLVGTIFLAAQGAGGLRHTTESQLHAGHFGTTPGWSRLPSAPIHSRSEYVAVWTGREMIVWGGYSGNSDYSDGAAYDPTTRTWVKIAAAPLSPRAAPVGVWTGKEMLVFGGSSNTGFYSDGAAFDPTTNTWRTLAPIPSSLGGNLTATGSYAVWTGRRMLVWGFFGKGGGGAHGGGSLAAASYDPATNTWTTDAAAPVQAPIFGDAFWTGKEMLVWGPPANAGGGDLAYLGIAFDPATEKWIRLPDSPLARGSRYSTLAVWTGTEMVVGGGTEMIVGRFRDDAAYYTPATNTWHRLPNAPVGFTGNNNYPDIWTGKSVLAIEDSVAGGRPLSLNLAAGRWSLGPKAPIPGRQEADEIWTGSEALVWGGGTMSGHSCCIAVVPGYSYAPRG